MARLILICGLPGAGKTTLARRLAGERRAVRLCPDEWMLGLGGRLSDETLRDRVEQRMRAVAEELLSDRVDVILEFGFWVRAERDQLRLTARRFGAEVELHYLDVPLPELRRRLAARDRALGPERAVGITPEQLARWAAAFEAPTAEELARFDSGDRTAATPIRAVMVFAEEPEVTARWWAEHLGGTATPRRVGEALWLYERDEVEVALHPADDGRNPGGASVVVYWSVNDLRTDRERLLAAGCRPHRGPLRIDAGRQICQLVDPFGNVFGLDGP